MKVCIFTETYYPLVGGGEVQARALASQLSARGVEVVVLTRRSDASYAASENHEAVTIHRLPPVGPQHYKKWGLLLSGLIPLFRHRADVIYVSGFRVIGLLAVIVSRVTGRVCVLKADSQGEMSGEFFAAGLRKLRLNPNWLIFKAFLRMRNRILRQADCFVAISTAIQTELIASGVSASKIRMIPNSVDLQVFHPVQAERKRQLRQSLGLPTDVSIVMYTGRLVTYKGLPLLLRVWKDVTQRHEGAVLVLVGSGGLDIANCEDELRQFVQDNDLQERVFFTGAVNNVAAYLQSADIFAFPSENEAFGISVIEAMACGLPVVTTAAGGLRDLVQHEENGLVVPGGQALSLQEALTRLLEAPGLASGLGSAACETALTRFGVDAVVEQYLNLFQNLTNGQ